MAKGQVYTCINKPKKGSVVIVFIDLPEHKIKKNTVKRMIKKYYKEQIGSLIQYKIDLNGNIILKQLRGLNKKIQKGMINNLIKIYKKGKTNIVYTFFIKYFFMEKIQEIGEEVEVSEEDKEGLNWVIRIQRGRKKIKEIKEKFLEYKIKNQTKIFNLMSRRTPRVFQKDANTKRIKKKSIL